MAQYRPMALSFLLRVVSVAVVAWIIEVLLPLMLAAERGAG